MASMSIRDARALHQEALDLRSFLSLKEYQEQRGSDDSEPGDDGEDESRSPSPTDSPRHGIILFDPTILSFNDDDSRNNQDQDHDYAHDATIRMENSPQHAKRRPFRLQLTDLRSSQKDDPANNQTTHDTTQRDTHGHNDDRDGESEAATTERMRSNVIDEICSTEQSYVTAIRTLHDYYIVPLEDNKHPIMEDAQIAVFFDIVRHLVLLNSKLHNDLTDIVEKRRRGILVPLASPVYLQTARTTVAANSESMAVLPTTSTTTTSSSSSTTTTTTSPTRRVEEPTEGIGAVFCRYAPLFKLYGGYAKDYEEVAQLLQSYKRDSRLGFAQFLETCRLRSGSDESFESLLIKPIQRIPRYKLLLERICAYTPEGHRDEAFLTEAVSRVAGAASLINETVRDQENLESVLEAQKKFAGQLSLVTTERRLLRSGKLTKMSTKRHEEVMLHLFNDILVYSGVLITGGYRVRRVVQLTSKAVGVRTQIPASHHSLFQYRNLRYDCGFVVTSLEKTFVLFAASPDERKIWIEAITTAIHDAQTKQSKLQSKNKNQCTSNGTHGTGAGGHHCNGNSSSSSCSAETPADAAALWVPDSVAGACTVCKAGFKVYFRRHHCRRCGAVVCGNCSARRSILFVGDSSREERVCTPCFKVLRLVKIAAFKWLSIVVEFKGVLRRKRWNKWSSEHYYELKAGILKQYTLSSANGLNAKCCTDTIDLTGAIVIHRSDERSLKNRFCFQISTAEMLDQELTTTSCVTSPQSGRGGGAGKKLSPLKAAVSRFTPDGSGGPNKNRESVVTILSSEGSGSNLAASFHSSRRDDLQGWVLCASSHTEEMEWSAVIQRSADRALLRARRSRVTECAFPVPFERMNSNMSVVSLGGGGAGGASDVDPFLDDASKLERRRFQIMKEIVRAEESYVTCLGECIRVFVQPLLLRQLEAQKLLRRKQSKRKKSFLHALGGSGSNALHAAAALAQRKYSSPNLHSLTSSMRLVSSGSSRSMPLLMDHGASTSAGGLSKSLVLDADMAIFFSSIDQLCTLNQQLLEHLSRHVDEIKNESISSSSEDRGVYRPGAIFSAYAPLFQLYTSYASRYQAALNAIQSPQFVAFLKEMPDEASVHRLRTYLNMPMERIPRYKVFLQELLESTSPDHIDYAPLQAAMKSVNQVANKIEEITARKESARKLDEVSAKVGIDLRGKRFVMDGQLKKVCRSKVQQYYFVLLEDALVYGRLASGLHKKKFRLIELAECKVSDETESIPRAVNAATGGTKSHNAFYFFSPLKSFILVANTEDEKSQWKLRIQESIDRTLRGGPRQSSRRASIRSELLLDEEDPSNDYDLENAFVIKNGWLNVVRQDHKAIRRMWITLNMQSLSMSAFFKGAQLEDTISLAACEAVAMNEATFFRIYVRNAVESCDAAQQTVDIRAFTFETQTSAEREEWLRALSHCISGTNGQVISGYGGYGGYGGGGAIGLGGGIGAAPTDLMAEMMSRRRSLNSATHAPILLFNKVSSVCMICYQSFAVYRPRHHCRLCGSLVCGHCSKRKWTLSYGTSKKASRICDGCAEAATGSASSLVSEM